MTQILMQNIWWCLHGPCSPDGPPMFLLPPPHALMTGLLPAIWKLWFLLSGRHLTRCVWGGYWRWLGEYQTLIFLCHPASQRPHLQQPVQVAHTHRLTIRPPQRCTQLTKSDFLDFQKVLLSLFSFYPFNEKTSTVLFFSSRMPTPCSVNALPRSRPSLFEFLLFCSKIIAP